MSFDELNDDCWLAIIKYLEVRDQISLYEATKGISSRLNACVIQNWKFEQCFYIDETSVEKFLAMPEMLNIFLNRVSRNMRRLKLDHVRVEFLKRCVDFTFPNMKTLDYKLCISHLEDQSAAADECLRLMIELFPGLRSLKAHKGLNFNMLQHFTQLRKLELTPSTLKCCGPDETTIGKSQLLEEVTVHYVWDGVCVFTSIESLPKLHSVFFHVYHVSDIFRLCCHVYYLRVKIGFNNGIRQYDSNSIVNLMEIEPLVDFFSIDSETLRRMLPALKRMLQLDLMDLKILSKAEMQGIENIDPSLTLHHVSHIRLEKEFFKAGDKRFMEKAPFTLFYHKKRKNELAIGLKVQVASMSIRIPDRMN